MGFLGATESFSARPEVLSFQGLLFDFDGKTAFSFHRLSTMRLTRWEIIGTIIDSTDAIVKHWHLLGKEMGVDPNVILASSHGRRSIDVLKLYDESKANWNCKPAILLSGNYPSS